MCDTTAWIRTSIQQSAGCLSVDHGNSRAQRHQEYMALKELDALVADLATARNMLADLRVENETKDVAARRFFTALDAVESYSTESGSKEAVRVGDELIDSRDCLRRVFNFS